MTLSLYTVDTVNRKHYAVFCSDCNVKCWLRQANVLQGCKTPCTQCFFNSVWNNPTPDTASHDWLVSDVKPSILFAFCRKLKPVL